MLRKLHLKLMTNKVGCPSDSESDTEIKNSQTKSGIRKSLDGKQESPQKRLKVVQKKIKKLEKLEKKLKDRVEADNSSSEEEEEEEKEEKEVEKVLITEQKSNLDPVDNNVSKEVKEKEQEKEKETETETGQFDKSEHERFIHLEKVAFMFIVEIDDYFGSLIGFLQSKDIKPLIFDNERFLALTIDKVLLKRCVEWEIEKNDGGFLLPNNRIGLLRGTLSNFKYDSLPNESNIMDWYSDIKDMVEYIVEITKRMLDYENLSGVEGDLLKLHKKAIIKMRLCNTNMTYGYQLNAGGDNYTTLMQLEIIDHLLKIDLE